MARPKVFVSSTCYDLQQIRDSICTFIRSMGFEPVLSENGDVFFHPDLHTHEACVNEVSNCQIFLLIIGGRFGGKYIYDKSKSITNAEYDAAVKSNIPVFTYIKRNVLDNHLLYQENKDKPFISELDFPAIDQSRDSINIFNFINHVRKASINNAYEPFELSSEIENHLRKQWAAMFFDFLKNREITQQIDHTSKSVDSLIVTTDKLEELVKSLYMSLDSDNAPLKIDEIQAESLAKEFFLDNVAECYPGYVNAKTEKELIKLSQILPSNMAWHEYLNKITLLELDEKSTTEKIRYGIPDKLYDIDNEYEQELFTGIHIDPKNPYQIKRKNFYDEGVCRLSQPQRLQILRDFSNL